MALLVQKFGGTSVADPRRILGAAAKILAEHRAGHRVIAVASAMYGVTDELIGYHRQLLAGSVGAGALPSQIPHGLPESQTEFRDDEYDTAVSSGEQITAGLLAAALRCYGIRARSWLGWQLPLYTTADHGRARITHIDTRALLEGIEAGEVAVIAGFQGLSASYRITTLGRGGSDTTAVAVAVAVGADRCDIYTDVDGIYTADPRVVDVARRRESLTYEEMLELASQGSKVLHFRAVELAMRYQLVVQVLSSFGSRTASELPGTLVLDESSLAKHSGNKQMVRPPAGQDLERETISGISCDRNQAKISLISLADRPGVAAAIFGVLARHAINVDLIVQSVSADGKLADITFTVGRCDLERSHQLLEQEQRSLGFSRLLTDLQVAKISVVGVGMRSHSGVAVRMFQTLASHDINIQVISTSEIKISVLIAEQHADLALRTLHAAYDLDTVGAAPTWTRMRPDAAT